MKLLLTLLFTSTFMLGFSAKKSITKRTWLVYNALSESGDSRSEDVKQEPLAVLTFRPNGTFSEHIIGDKTILPGKWEWNKKPETQNGKKCLNLSFHKMSNVSPSKKVFAAVTEDYENVQLDYNFVGHDQKYTGFSYWIARITVDEMLGEWLMSFDTKPEGWPDKDIKFSMKKKDKNAYSLESLNGTHQEEGTWSIKNNYLVFHPATENPIMTEFRLDPAFYNAKSRNLKVLLSDKKYHDCRLMEVIILDQLVGKWNIGDLEIEFDKSYRFKVNNPSDFEKYVPQETSFDIFKWEIKNNVITFLPETACDKCSVSIPINLYEDGRELTFGEMDYETAKFKKQL